MRLEIHLNKNVINLKLGLPNKTIIFIIKTGTKIELMKPSKFRFIYPIEQN